MTRLFRILGVASAALALGAQPARLQAAPLRGFEGRLAEAVAEGRLDAGRAALYRLYALKAPERLPAEYRAPAAAVRGRPAREPAAEGWRARCGTTLLRGVREAVETLPEAERAEALALLTPDLPRPAARVTALNGKAVTHALGNWLVTANFSIEWGPELTNEDGTLPLRDDDRDNLPDVAERWAAYFEAAYQAEVQDRGYAPAAVAANLVPVYLGNSDPTRTLENIGGSTYAITQEALPVPYVVVSNDLSFVPSNGEGASGTLAGLRGAMKVTAAHEFFHVLQFDRGLPSTWQATADDWWLEASATWMEDEVFDGVDDYYQYFQGGSGWPSFAAAGLPVRSTDADYVTRAYGAVLFAKYLSEHAGGADSIRDVWGRIWGGQRERILPALESFALAEGFTGGLGELFVGFAGANATMDYEEGARYGRVPVDERDTLEASSTNWSTTPASPANPSYLGAVTLHRAPATAGTLGRNIALSGTPAGSWGLAVAVPRSGGGTLVLGGTGAGGTTVTVEDLGVTRLAWASLAFLQPGGRSTAWQLSEPFTSLQGEAPGAPLGRAAAPATGGLDVTWTAPAAGSPRGYVVQWRKGATGAFASRTLFGPVGRAEVRGLDAGASYEVRVAAYDGRGAEGTPAETSADAGPAPDPTVPDAAVTDENVPLFLDALRPSAAGRLAFPLEVLGGGLGAADFVAVDKAGVGLSIADAGYGRLLLDADTLAASPGTYTVTIHTPTETRSLPLTVVAGTLAVGSVEPAAADPGDVLEATVYGTALDEVMSAEFDDPRFSLVLGPGDASLTILPVTIDVPADAAPGSYPFTLHTPTETARGTLTVGGSGGGGGGGGGGGCFVGALAGEGRGLLVALSLLVAGAGRRRRGP